MQTSLPAIKLSPIPNLQDEVAYYFVGMKSIISFNLLFI